MFSCMPRGVQAGGDNRGSEKGVSYLGSRYAICASGAASVWAKNVHKCFLVRCFKHTQARSRAFLPPPYTLSQAH